MKGFRAFALLMAVASMTLFSCSPKTQGSGEKVSLEMHLEKGQVFKRVSRMDQEIKTKMMGISNNMHQGMEFYINQEVVDVNGEGVANVRVVYDRIVYSVEAPIVGEVSYDSKEGSSPDNPFAMVMEPLIGNGFNIHLDKRGKVLDVIGMDEVFSQLGKQGGSDLSKTFDADNLKSTMQNMVAVYPEVLVGVGDTWGAEMEVSSELPMKLQMTYEVKEIEEKQVFLNVDGEISAKESEIAEGMGSVEMEGTQSGTLVVERSTGMVKEADFSQDISGSVKTMGMTTPMEIRSKIIVEEY